LPEAADLEVFQPWLPNQNQAFPSQRRSPAHSPSRPPTTTTRRAANSR
jgi:hypothetical protein